MIIKSIVAFDNNKGIGLLNKLPWKINEDMKKFVKLTKGNGKNAIIMGRNTWLSLKNKPLADRFNIVISTTLDRISNNNVSIFNNLEDAIIFCKDKFEEVWVIGGEKIYNEFLNRNLIDELYITEINKNYKCDTFFPEINYNKYKLISYNIINDKDNIPFLYNKIYIKI